MSARKAAATRSFTATRLGTPWQETRTVIRRSWGVMVRNRPGTRRLRPSRVAQVRGTLVAIEARDVANMITASAEAHRDKIKDLPARLQSVKMRDLASATASAGETEERIAKALGVETWLVVRACAALWKSTAAAERDRRSGPDATKQARGRITRQLRDELRAVINGDD